MPKGIPKKPGEEALLEGGGGGGGAGSGRMTVAERWASRNDPNSNWASLTGPKIPKEIKEERAARFKAERDALMEYTNKIPKTLTAEQKAGMSPAQLRRAERAEKNFADKSNTPVETPEGMKKGGMTASRRADGIASRGKTKGRMV
jgi:hypothetical protein